MKKKQILTLKLTHTRNFIDSTQWPTKSSSIMNGDAPSPKKVKIKMSKDVRQFQLVQQFPSKVEPSVVKLTLVNGKNSVVIPANTSEISPQRKQEIMSSLKSPTKNVVLQSMGKVNLEPQVVLTDIKHSPKKIKLNTEDVKLEKKEPERKPTIITNISNKLPQKRLLESNSDGGAATQKQATAPATKFIKVGVDGAKILVNGSTGLNLQQLGLSNVKLIVNGAQNTQKIGANATRIVATKGASVVGDKKLILPKGPLKNQLLTVDKPIEMINSEGKKVIVRLVKPNSVVPPVSSTAGVVKTYKIGNGVNSIKLPIPIAPKLEVSQQTKNIVTDVKPQLISTIPPLVSIKPTTASAPPSTTSAPQSIKIVKATNTTTNNVPVPVINPLKTELDEFDDDPLDEPVLDEPLLDEPVLDDPVLPPANSKFKKNVMVILPNDAETTSKIISSQRDTAEKTPKIPTSRQYVKADAAFQRIRASEALGSAKPTSRAKASEPSGNAKPTIGRAKAPESSGNAKPTGRGKSSESLANARSNGRLFDRRKKENKVWVEPTKIVGLSKEQDVLIRIIEQALMTVPRVEIRKKALQALAESGIGLSKQPPKGPSDLVAVKEAEVQTDVTAVFDDELVLSDKVSSSAQQIKIVKKNVNLNPRFNLEAKRSMQEGSLDFLGDTFNKIDSIINKPRSASEKIMRKLEQDYEEAISFDSQGYRPLHRAVLRNNVNEVKRWIMIMRAAKMDIDSRSSDGKVRINLFKFKVFFL